MAFTFKRALRAMAITSSTTSVAFFVNITSGLMPIRAFGIFAGIIVLVNYLLVVFLFPPSVILYERYIEERANKVTEKLCCCCKKKQRTEEITEEDKKKGKDEERKNNENKLYKALEHIFSNQWNAFIQNYKWIILVIVVVWTILASYLTT